VPIVPNGSTYAITGSDLSADDLRSLRHWMLDVHDLSGPIDLRRTAPRGGELGGVTDALVVAAGPGGALIALTGALVSWLRHRTADVTIKLVRADGSSMKIDGKRVRGVDAEQLSVMIEQLAAQLADPAAGEKARAGTEPE
jgi:hypothetical protein